MLSLKSIAATGMALIVSTAALANEPNMHTEKDKMCCEKMEKNMSDKCCEKNDSEQ